MGSGLGGVVVLGGVERGFSVSGSRVEVFLFRLFRSLRLSWISRDIIRFIIRFIIISIIFFCVVGIR